MVNIAVRMNTNCFQKIRHKMETSGKIIQLGQIYSKCHINAYTPNCIKLLAGMNARFV